MAIIRLPTPLRSYADGQAEISVDGETVSAAIENLLSRYPPLRAHLVDGKGQLRPYVNLFLGEDNILDLNGLETNLKNDDRLLLIPSIAGG